MAPIHALPDWFKQKLDHVSYSSPLPGTRCFEIPPYTKEHFILEKIYISLIRDIYMKYILKRLSLQLF